MRAKKYPVLLMVMPSLMYAQDVKIAGNIDVSIPQSEYRVTTPQSKVSPSIRSIHLLKLQLSASAKELLEGRLNKGLQSNQIMTASSATGKNVQLGMGNVPVLDQGAFGTCVTFAVTAAIDAALNKGDYVSQLCSLQLGRYLENNAYTPSGWEGSWSSYVINQFDAFGLVNKINQQQVGCGGVNKYPLNSISDVPGTEMTPEQYHAISESLPNGDDGTLLYWTSILDVPQVFLEKPNMDQVLSQVKSSLDNKSRLTFGVVLPGVYLGLAGAVGKYHQASDTWVVTPEVINALDNDEDLAGHEMVITGYNDDAIAIDNHGVAHKGLLTLRNSWGDKVADKGNFYMSYAYFKALVLEAKRITMATE
mgnify:CR=1 FL=1